MPENLYTIPREEAAKKLDVSTRTLDRWLKVGKLKYRTEGRSVLVHEGELALLLSRMQQQAARRSPASQPSAQEEDLLFSEPLSGTHVVAQPEETVYKKLYEDTAQELKAKQDKLEAASFRVGQLESALSASVPLLEHKAASERLQTENATLTSRLAVERIRAHIFLGTTIAGALLLIAGAIFVILSLR